MKLRRLCLENSKTRKIENWKLFLRLNVNEKKEEEDDDDEKETENEKR